MIILEWICYRDGCNTVNKIIPTEDLEDNTAYDFKCKKCGKISSRLYKKENTNDKN